MRRFVSLLIGLPVSILVIALAVANRREVLVSLDPFSPSAPVLSMTVPLYAVIFGALILGVVLGGLVTWLRQGRFRREARQARRDLKKTGASPAAPAPGLTLPAPRT